MIQKLKTYDFKANNMMDVFSLWLKPYEGQLLLGCKDWLMLAEWAASPFSRHPPITKHFLPQ